MTIKEELRLAASYASTIYPRPCYNGKHIDELMLQAVEVISRLEARVIRAEAKTRSRLSVRPGYGDMGG